MVKEKQTNPSNGYGDYCLLGSDASSLTFRSILSPASGSKSMPSKPSSKVSASTGLRNVRLCLLLTSYWLLSWLTLRHWRWKQYDHLKCHSTSTRLDGVTTQMIVPFIVCTVRISNPTVGMKFPRSVRGKTWISRIRNGISWEKME
jgi:hypothetical protein